MASSWVCTRVYVSTPGSPSTHCVKVGAAQPDSNHFKVIQMIQALAVSFGSWASDFGFFLFLTPPYTFLTASRLDSRDFVPEKASK
jgi:hypothetical protein